jgi:acyl carrier protein
VLDRSLRPVPIGVAGELYIGGAGLARGYLRRPGLTAERFIPDPFSNRPGGRLYKTGDLVRYRSNGSLDFLGRNDEQVKVRGFRIELGEIEAVLRQHSGVREAAVVTREDTPGEKRLVAYVVPEPEMPLTLGQLNHYLQARLPHYMIPAPIVTLEQLPLSPNGKLDRRALPAPEADLLDREARYMPPRNAVEEVLAGVWAEVLRVERVGIYDDFFSLGGHSLLATQVVSRLRELLAVEVPLRVLFEAPSVAALAEYLQQARQTPPQEIDEGISRIPMLSRGESDVDQLLEMLEQLSVEEVDALLNSMLSERKERN